MEIQAEGLKALERSLGQASKKMPYQLNSAINKTLTFTASQKAKAIGKRINMSQKNIKKNLKKIKSNKTTLQAMSILAATGRPSLKDFRGTRQNKKGVSYLIDKQRGRKTVPGGFMGPRPGQLAASLNGHAFKRTGYTRTPITRLDGVSPWAIYVFNSMDPAIKKKVSQRLAKEIQEKIRVNVLRSQGLI